MTRKLFTLILFIASASFLSAQEKGFYLRGGLGYNFPMAGGTMDNSGFPFNGSVTNISNGDVVYSLKSASFSSGLSGEIGLGYMFNKYLGVQLDMSIGLANTKYTGSENNIIIHDSTYGNVSVSQYANTPILLMPSVVLQNGGGVFNVYVRAGVVLPLSTRVIQEQAVANLPGNGAVETDVYTIELKNSFSLGLTGAIGMQYNLGPRTSFWAEVNMLSLSLYPKEGELTGVTVNGASYPLSNFSTTTIKYGNNITVPAGSSGIMQPTYSIPFSNVGIHLGMTVKFPHEDHSKGRYMTPKQFHRD